HAECQRSSIENFGLFAANSLVQDDARLCGCCRALSESVTIHAASCIMNLTPLGDQAVLARFEREADALHFGAALRAAGLPAVIDVVPAYFSVAVFYDLERTRCAELARQLETLHAMARRSKPVNRPLHVIPCCYDFGPDLPQVAEQLELS